MSRPLHSTSSRPSRGFTLVEILVVVAIIVILMAILIPVAMRAISQARNAAIGLELSQLKTGFEEYKKEHGDYPPSMGQNYLPANRYGTVAERHLLRCYPKMDLAQKDFFYTSIAPYLGNDEVIVFWLGLIANDPRAPFKNFSLDSSNNLVFAPLPGSAAGSVGVYPGPYTRYVHFEFDERRARDLDGDNLPSYEALYSRQTPYVYFDSRTYRLHLTPATAGVGACQPFNDYLKVQASLNASVNPDTTFVNPNTFQIHCAGQDGNFGMLVTAVDPSNNFNFLNSATAPWQQLVKTFGPVMNNTNEEDSDNMADFTEGRRLIDHRAP